MQTGAIVYGIPALTSHVLAHELLIMVFPGQFSGWHHYRMCPSLLSLCYHSEWQILPALCEAVFDIQVDGTASEVMACAKGHVEAAL